ncbi:MAG: hypothetical protein ACOXZV_12715 [Bacteroidales bacterium]
MSPGWIETGDYCKLSEQDHKQHFSGRLGKPEDVAGACLYLTTPGMSLLMAPKHYYRRRNGQENDL